MFAIDINSSNYESEVRRSSSPVLLDVWAPWCGYCKTLAPIIDEIALEHPEIKVCKLNADEEGDIVKELGVRGLPTVFVIRDGKIINKNSGVATKHRILAMLAGATV